MMQDIYATTMHGHFTSTNPKGNKEHGQWTYRGYGGAEIELHSDARTNDHQATRTVVRMHSVESKIDAFDVGTEWTETTADRRRHLAAEVEGVNMKLQAEGFADQTIVSQLNLPPETIIDGPSPVFLIHQMLSAMPPDDRSVTLPVAIVAPHVAELESRFYRMKRVGRTVSIAVLDNEGSETGTIRVEVAEDGCPEVIERDGIVTEVVRNP